MQTIITKDTLISQIPSHIYESYPKFFDFIEAYYEWVSQEGNPYERIKNHLSYMDFTKSLDEYVSFMKSEYLSDVPESVLLDKEMFIKWSKKFNISRGSHASYKFLFNVLFNENDTEVYLPKENILRTSDGVWIDNEFRLIVTNSGDLSKFNLARIFQKKEIFPNVFEYAYANVQSVKNRYSGRYNTLELIISDVEGTFESDYPIETESGASEYIINTISNFSIFNAGEGYTEGSRVSFDNVGDYEITRLATTQGSFNTRTTTFFNELDVEVFINTIPSNNFTFDGMTVHSTDIEIGDTVTVTMPSYEGYMVVNDLDPKTNSIKSISVLDPPIGIFGDRSLNVSGNLGSNFNAFALSGVIGPVDGYYEDNRGHLSSNMYLQDSSYYQEFSYVIRTKQSIESYSDIIKKILHPAGFAMFGYVRIIELIEILISIKDEEYNILPLSIESRSKYSMGANYSFFDRFKSGLSGRLYNVSHFNDKPYVDPIIKLRIYMDDEIIQDLSTYIEQDIYKPSYSYRYDLENAIGQGSEYMVDNYVLFPNDYVESDGYDLADESIGETYIDSDYYSSDFVNDGYYEDQDNWSTNSKGWMTKHYLSDYHLYIPQDYSLEIESGDSYFETGYTSQRI